MQLSGQSVLVVTMNVLICAVSELHLDQISGYAIETDEWMITVCLIMEVPSLSLLGSIGREQGRIKI